LEALERKRRKEIDVTLFTSSLDNAHWKNLLKSQN
jgi:hypothetical protein